jgi:hypothetical protein
LPPVAGDGIQREQLARSHRYAQRAAGQRRSGERHYRQFMLLGDAAIVLIERHDHVVVQRHVQSLAVGDHPGR